MTGTRSAASFIALLVAMGAVNVAAAGSTSGPPAPQLPGQFDSTPDGQPAEPQGMTVVNPATAGANDRWVLIAPGDSLYVDPHAGNFSTPGPARYITIPSTVPGAVKFPIATPAEWESFYWGTQTQAPPPGITAVIACRPVSVNLCLSSTGGAVAAQINGSGTNGYAQLGQTGSATASCVNSPYGDYTETATYTCGATGSGATADGAWSPAVTDADACAANSYEVQTTSCSASCGGGNFYKTIYNSCGAVTNQGYIGAACNTQSCCAPSFSKSCSNSTATYTDTSCGLGSYTVPNGCTYVSEVVGGRSCSFSIPDYSPGGASPSGTTYTEFLDCGGPSFPNGDSWGDWGTTSGAGVSCAPDACSPAEPYYAFTNGVQTGSGHVCGVNSVTCTYSGWQ